MFYANDQPQFSTTIRMAFSAYFIFILMFLLIAPQISAHGTYPLSRGPRIKKIDAGLGGMYRDGNWVPIQISLENNGPEFDGKIAINFPSTFMNSEAAISSTYQQAISLPSLSNKQVTMYVPVTSGTQGYNQLFTANLIDNNGHKVTSQSSRLQGLNRGTLFIGLVTANSSLDPTLLVASLNTLHIAIQLQIVKPEQFPTRAAVLNNFDMIVLDNLTGSALTHDQIASLQSWVHQGGILVTVGGPEWHATVGTLPSNLLPVAVTGNGNLPAGTHLLPVESQPSGNSGGGQIDTIANPVAISVVTANPGTNILLSSGSMPLIVQTNEGQGFVYYLAYDPFLSPLVNWVGISYLWEGLIMRSLGSKLLVLNTPRSASSLPSKAVLYGNMDSFLHALTLNFLPPIWLILVLLLSYVLILGPIRLLVVRWTKKRYWTPRIVLSTIVVFSLLSYGLAVQAKSSSIVSSRISVIEVNRPDSTGSAEHITDYLAMFIPSQGDSQMHVPASNLIQLIDPIANLYSTAIGRSSLGRNQTTITSFANETAVDLQGVSRWTVRTLVSQYDTHTTGGLISHLTLTNQPKNIVTGTVINTLPYALNDAYLLIGEDFAPLGTLAPRQTKPVSLVLNASLKSGAQLLLADRIAASRGLSIAPLSSSPGLDTLHRHSYMLGSLSNDCGMGLCPHNAMGSGMQTTRQDPLLLSGASATLIGWASSQATETNAVTIGGITSPQIQEALVRAPLAIDFSGTVTIPASLIASQIVNIQVTDGNLQGYGRSPSPGVYCMVTGSMTFELTLPTKSQLQNSRLAFAEEKNPAGRVGPCMPGTTGTATHLHIMLYNWQNSTWDEKPFNTYKFNVDNAQSYIGPGGRILIQFDNQDLSLGSIIFTTPTVEVNGTIKS